MAQGQRGHRRVRIRLTVPLPAMERDAAMADLAHETCFCWICMPCTRELGGKMVPFAG